MKQTEFEPLLRQSLHMDGWEMHRETVVFQARKEAGKRRKRISFWTLLKKQAVFLGWKLWLSQGLMLLAAVWMLGRLYGQPFWEGSALVIRLLYCLSTVVSMMTLPLVYRAVRYRMQEIETATYFSSRKLLLTKLLVIGLGDILLLLGMAAAVVVKTSLQAGYVSLAACLPFLAVSSGSLYMLGHWKAEGFFAGSLGLGCMVLLFMIVAPGRFLPRYGVSWLIVCGILLAFCIGQLRYLFTRSSYAELQI